MEFPKSVKDEIFRGITYESLIIAAQSNYGKVTQSTIRLVFSEIFEQNLEDAIESLKNDMGFILSQDS